MSNSEAVANIDFLSSIPSETLQASGRYGQVYLLQRQLDQANDHLHRILDTIDEQIRANTRPGSLGLSTPNPMDHPDVRAQLKHIEELRVQVAEAQAEVGGIVFLPATDNLPKIEKRLASLNRRANKIGTEKITLTVTDETLVLNYKSSDEDTRGYDFEHVFAVLRGTTPKIPGFEFLASVTPTEHGNVVKRIPAAAYGFRHHLDDSDVDPESGKRVKSVAQSALDSIDLSRFHHSGTACERCHTIRDRKELFVVYSDQSGEAIQVGRECLRDYTGINDPERVLKALEQVWEFIREIHSRSETPVIYTEDFMTHVATLMRAAGHYERGLGHEASRNYYDRLNQRRDKQTGQPLWIEPTEYDRAQAIELLKWARNFAAVSEFETNIQIALASQVIDPRFFGIAGATFLTRERWEKGEQERQVKAQRKAAHAEKTHIGTIGQRQTFTLTVKKIIWIADRYGYGDNPTKPLIIMTDEHDNEVKWFASSLPSVADKTDNDWPIEGGTYQVKGTIKYHDESEEYGKSTVITRCKFEKTVSEPEAQ